MLFNADIRQNFTSEEVWVLKNKNNLKKLSPKSLTNETKVYTHPG